MWTMWYVCMYSHVYVGVYTTCGVWDSTSGIPQPYCLRQGLSWNLKLTDLPRLTGQWLPEIHPSSLTATPHAEVACSCHNTQLFYRDVAQPRPSFSNSKSFSRWATSLVPGIAFLMGIKSGSTSAPGFSLQLKPHGQILLARSQIEVSNDTRCSDTVGDDTVLGFPHTARWSLNHMAQVKADLLV